MSAPAQADSAVPRNAAAPEAMSFWMSPKFIAGLATGGIFLHLVLRYAAGVSSSVSEFPLIVVLAVGGLPLLVPLTRKLIHGEFGSDHLAGISIVTSVLLGEYLAGTIVILMLSGGTALEEFASGRASSVLDALARRMPQTAHRKEGDQMLEVSLDAIRVDDVLVVFPHEVCPVDGVVLAGHGKMNEAYLTGEPFEIAKAPGIVGSFRRHQRRLHPRHSRGEAAHRFPLRADHAGDAGNAAETSAHPPPRRHARRVVHARGPDRRGRSLVCNVTTRCDFWPWWWSPHLVRC